MKDELGISGRITRSFLTSEITPLLALVAFLLGAFAVFVTPREEEPQINVTFANIFIAYPGASAREVEELVSTPAEQKISELEGLKHVYSVSRPGMSVLTVQFEVGVDRTQAIVRLYNAIYSNQDWFPPNMGVGQPIIKPKGIDDVPIVTLTLWTEDEARGAYELGQVAHSIEAELKRVKGTRNIYTVGAPEQVVHVQFDPVAMAGYKLSIDDLRSALQSNNIRQTTGPLVRNNESITMQVGQFFSTAKEVENLVVGLHKNRPVFLRDIARVSRGADQPEQYAWLGTGPAAAQKGIHTQGEFPSVTLAIAKQPGTNAVNIARQVIDRVEELKGVFIPQGINVTVTRNYGKTANAKAQQLIGKLVFATAFVVLLVFFALGKRESLIVGIAVVITLSATLFASWAWGFTLNRVSLFALIFSIGILVDDAIVIVENIHRHMQKGDKSLLESIPAAVDEVGGPTILATFTVIAALLPMAFVSGLMGPYMSPIPINASMGMFISLLIAIIVTPWMANKILPRHHVTVTEGHDGKFYHWFEGFITPFLNGRNGALKRRMLALVILALIVLSVGLVAVKLVVLKMLPFDNKSEFQVVVDMPEGTPLEQSARVLSELGRYLSTVPEVTDYQVYVGDASPINFNGLIRQYYLRKGGHVGDIQVNLADKSARHRKSHEIAFSVRHRLEEIGKKFNAIVKVVEIPPGPPVMAPLVAEIYGLDYQGQISIAREIGEVFRQTTGVVDVDDSIENNAQKIIIKIDQQRAAMLGVSRQQVVSLVNAALTGDDVSYLHSEDTKFPLPVRLELSEANKSNLDTLLSMKVRGQNGNLVALSSVISLEKTVIENAIYHKDLQPVVFVTGDFAGGVDSPLYGMFDIMGTLSGKPLSTINKPISQLLVTQPDNPYEYSLKWDGEWQITYETFRDMGIAYGVGLILIYLLVVAQFKSYLVPLIIMAPIPLTVIGVLPGHALWGTQFTATSMIGMIALAGIIVRNSILLVDFINQQVEDGVAFEEAIIRSGVVRAKPIILTGLAAMLGAFFILDDPIFSGLAVSLIFGILISTVLTLIVIPILYYALMYKRFT